MRSCSSALLLSRIVSAYACVCLKIRTAGGILKVNILMDMREFSAVMVFFWIILYGFIFHLASQPFAPLCFVAFDAALLWWCCTGKRRERLGITVPVLRGKEWGYLLPLLLLPVWQLCLFRTLASDLLPLATAVLAEELLFRGFLLPCLCRRSVNLGVFGTALLFALLHGLNYLGGYEPIYVALQVVTAFSAGLFWALLRLRSRSLLPCLLAHFLINLTAVPDAVTVPLFFYGLLVCCLLMVCCSIPLYRRVIHGGTYETIH